MLRSSVSVATSPLSKHGSPTSNKAFEAATAAIGAALGGGEADAAFPSAVLQETLRQDAALIAGIAAYRRHPFRRDLPDPPAIWAEGGSRLLDYGMAGAGGPAVLFAPSLVNRAYVLDLAPGHSLLRWLAARGMRPLLLDWGWPEEAERRFTLTDYVAGRLERALGAARQAAGGPVVLAGYCMGGTLSVAAAARRPDLVRALALLATPWDFHGADQERAARLASLLPLLEPALSFAGTLPVDMIQVLFAMLDPFGVAEKYRAFSRLPPEGERAALFVALEDWLNDGVPLAAPVARECLRDWYGANAPATGQWMIAGLPVDPRRLAMPTFVAAPARDRIVPPESSRPLAELIPDAVLHEPRAGHIGMTAGGGAERALWQPLLDWLRGLDRA
ncbi:MAG: alpha/beta fold hydrolase [Proteobacteria bacterium]|nr:alpha/beta fold hydrolase [Pseudomonadota bacterium]